MRGTNQVDEVTAPAGTEVLIGAPANAPPQELVVRLRDRCEEHPEIAAAYLFQMMVVLEGERPSLALGLVLADPAAEDRVRELVEDLGKHAHPLRAEDEYLTIQVLDDASLAAVAQSVEPFFQRSVARS
jgi:hypothetical protein